jgi:hypothetical protein
VTDLASAAACLRNVLGFAVDLEEEAIGLSCSDVTRPASRWSAASPVMNETTAPVGPHESATKMPDGHGLTAENPSTGVNRSGADPKVTMSSSARPTSGQNFDARLR